MNSSDPDYDPLQELCLEIAYIDVNILEAVNYSPKDSLSFLNQNGTAGQSIIDIAISQNQNFIGFLS